MRTFLWLIVCSGLLCTLLLWSLFADTPPSTPRTGESHLASPPATTAAHDEAAGRPLAFVENRGQAGPKARFHVEGAGHSVLFAPDGVTFHRRRDDGAARIEMRFPGAGTQPAVTGVDPKRGVAHFYRGADPSRWRTAVPTYGGVRYEALYPGIDLVYDGVDGTLKSTFHVAPGADPTRIRMAYDGARTHLRDDGALVLRTALGELVEAPPVAYQALGDRRVEVEARYVLRGGVVRFALGPYDAARPLVIDPEFGYASFLGGSGEDQGEAVIVDMNGNICVTGFTASNDFPTMNGFQSHAGLRDAFVTSINASTGETVFSTFLGGTGHDQGTDLVVGPDGFVFLSGLTASTDFPVLRPVQGAYGGGDADGFLVVLDMNGMLAVSTYFGGSGNDQAWSVGIDTDNRVSIAGFTSSPDLFVFGGFQSVLQGTFDAFLTQFIFDTSVVPQFSLEASTYFGGSGDDQARGMQVGPDGARYLTGTTTSTDVFARTDLLALNPAQAEYGGGGADAWVWVWGPDLTAPTYATYLGGSAIDVGNGLALDRDGNVYVVGGTSSPDFPVTANADQPAFGGGDADGFLTVVFKPSFNFGYATYFGGEGYDEYFAVSVAPNGNVLAGGASEGSTLGTGAFVEYERIGTPDNFFYSNSFTFHTGGSGFTDVRATTVYTQSNVFTGTLTTWATGRTFSTDFPVTDDAFQGALAGDKDGWLGRLDVVNASADLQIIKQAQTTATGIRYTFTTVNAGPDDSPAATVTDVLPENLTPISPPQGCTYTPANRTLSCETGPLASDDTTEIIVHVDAPFGGPPVLNTATVGGDLPDPNGSNNTSTASALSPGPGSIHGQVFEDTNGNGVRDDDEQGIDDVGVILEAAWAFSTPPLQLTMSMDLNGDGSIDPETESGLYWFEDLLPSTESVRSYTVRQVGRIEGLGAPEPDKHRVYLGPNERREGVDFANEPVIRITVTTTEDVSDSNPGDGVCEPCSLRGAIEEAMAQSEDDPLPHIGFEEIVLGAQGKRTALRLTRPLPEISRPLVIDGGGRAVLDGSAAGPGADGLHASAPITVIGVTVTGFSGHGLRLESDGVTQWRRGDRVLRSAIHGNGGDGVHVADGDRTLISETILFGNGGLGIDVGGDGPTPNDDPDADVVLNHPVVTAVASGSTTIAGTLNPAPETDIVVEFFAGATCGASGRAQAETYLGAAVVPVDSAGAFTVRFDTTFAERRFITATAIAPDGRTSEFSPCNALTATAVERDPGVEAPAAFRLHPNYPNPFNPSTRIGFEVPTRLHVRLDVVDLRGRLVAVLVDETLPPGSYHTTFEAGALPSGMYFARLSGGALRETRPMIVLK